MLAFSHTRRTSLNLIAQATGVLPLKPSSAPGPAAIPRRFSSASFRPSASLSTLNPAARTATRKTRFALEQTTVRSNRAFLTMPGQDQGQEGEKKAKKPPPPLRPSSSILLLSPINQVLLLHRVHTSTSFASAHVFPGGNLSSFHDGPVPPPDSPAFHQDGPAYRLAAIRETFEESGILLARKSGQSLEQRLLHVPDDVREAGRKQIHGNQVKFIEWLRSQGGEPDVENLIPFTRWITPYGPPKRFTLQMYLYMLPLSPSPTSASPLPDHQQSTIIPTPTHDGGLEHTAATFDDASNWLSRAQAGEIILFPPQFYLLHLVSEFLHLASDRKEQYLSREYYQSQRDALLSFLRRVPATTMVTQHSGAAADRLAQIPWSDKVMSPAVLFKRKGDGRLVLGVDKPGPELKGTDRGGDWERVVLLNFKREGPRDVEVRFREEVLREEREGEGEGNGEGAKL